MSEAPDHIDMPEIEWQSSHDAYMDGQDIEFNHSEYLIHQDGFAAGWTLGQEVAVRQHASADGVRVMAIELGATCGTCHCDRRWHYQTYSGDAGCTREVGTINPILCACTGFMMTEAPELIEIHQAEMGKRLFRAAVARQDRIDGAKYRASLDNDQPAPPTASSDEGACDAV